MKQFKLLLYTLISILAIIGILFFFIYMIENFGIGGLLSGFSILVVIGVIYDVIYHTIKNTYE